MAELVTIPIAAFEFVAEYEHPRFWVDRTVILEQLFNAFERWQTRVDDIEIITAGKISEQGITIKLPLRRASFFFGAASCKFIQEGVNWQSAEETLVLLDAAISTLIKVGDVNIRTNNVAISMHLQFKSTPFVSVLRPLLPEKLASIDAQPVITMAVVARWPDHKVTIDGSGIVANAIYVRLERDFPNTVNYRQMADHMLQDQKTIFRLLDVEEDLA